MTKQRPYATKRRLSKLFRAILVLAALKLALFVAIALDVPIPSIFFDFNGTGEPKAQAPAAEKRNPAAETRVSGVWKAPVNDIEARDDVKSIPLAQMKEEPQGQAAIVAARAHGNAGEDKAGERDKEPELPLGAYLEKDGDEARGAAVKLKTPSTPSIGALMALSGIDFSRDPVQGMAPSSVMASIAPTRDEADNSGQWWKNVLNLKQLPIPRFGAAQAAYAASLDMPPAPAVKGSGAPSPFLPPSEQMPVIPDGQDASGRVLPLRGAAPSRPEANAGAPRPAAPATPAAPASGGAPGYVNANMLRQQEDLARREQEVLMLKQQMDMRLNDLREAEKKVQDMLKDAKSAEDAKYKSLINMYRNMKPKQAALALASMEERVAVRILSGMSPKEAGEILSYADPKKTAKLSELITRMNTPGN